MILDAAWLARGWLTVYAASSNEPGRPGLYRAVHVEEYLHGVRLTCTDSYMILTSWIPERDHEFDPAPELDEAADRTATAVDTHGRAANLLTHLLKLATGEDAKPIDVRLRLGEPVVPGDDDNAITFDGMEATAVILEHPDHERVQLETWEVGFPEWRPLISRFKAVRTDAIALNPDLIGRLVKVAKLHGPGATNPLRWQFGGVDKAAGLEIGAGEPSVIGLVMPVRWDFEKDRPWAEPAGEQTAEPFPEAGTE